MPTARLARPPAARVHLILMLALTFSTGIVDAVGYLGLDKVFAGNMTGNVVILGMAAAGADDLPLLGPAIALLGFLAGALVGGRVVRPVAGGRWSRRIGAVFALVGAILAGLAGALFVIGRAPDGPPLLVIVAFLSVAMGLQAATARHLAVKDITTVVVTSLITGLAADAAVSGAAQPWPRRVLALVLLTAGALVGALTLRWHPGLGLGLAAGLTLAVAALGTLAWSARESTPTGR
ncbi:YoaK family protein [Nakamurella sp.]|uniref:YoaK family protein n=1 Tax=Nakamurella sp. TaxID=1869182 RepID=UPI003B3A065C